MKGARKEGRERHLERVRGAQRVKEKEMYREERDSQKECTHTMRK